MRHDRCLLVCMMGSYVDIEFRRKADPHQRIGIKQRTDETNRILDNTRQGTVIGMIILWRVSNHRIGAKVRYQIGDRPSGVRLTGKLSIGKAEQMRTAQFRQTFRRLGCALLYQLRDWPITTSPSIRGNSDPDLTDTSESFGLPATADLMFAIISTEQMETLGQVMVKQLKNRYNDPTVNKKFVIGIDRAKMKLYDVEQSAQDELVDNGQEDDTPAFDIATNGKFKKRDFTEFDYE